MVRMRISAASHTAKRNSRREVQKTGLWCRLAPPQCGRHKCQRPQTKGARTSGATALPWSSRCRSPKARRHRLSLGGVPRPDCKGRNGLVRNLADDRSTRRRRHRNRLHLRRRHLDPGGLDRARHRPNGNIIERGRKHGGCNNRAQRATNRFCSHVLISSPGPVPWIHEPFGGWKSASARRRTGQNRSA